MLAGVALRGGVLSLIIKKRRPAIGRCTLDLQTGIGLCTLSDGTGGFAGFHARARVTPPTDGVNWHWDGIYSFDDDF